MTWLWLFLVFRVIVSGVFIVSGVEKLLSPYQNFLYVIQNYQILPWPWLEQAVAIAFPWGEVILGVFLLTGLWTRLSLYGIGLMTSSFILVVGQAILRKLPIQTCGCFGELLKVPLPVIICMDATILLCVIVMARNLSDTMTLSLDRYFEKKSE